MNKTIYAVTIIIDGKTTVRVCSDHEVAANYVCDLEYYFRSLIAAVSYTFNTGKHEAENADQINAMLDGADNCTIRFSDDYNSERVKIIMTRTNVL